MQVNPDLFKYLARLLVLFTAMPIHECAHGFVASHLGDPTPKAQKRLSLNPFRHLDPIGSILIIATGFGWAKPVMVDARYFRNPKRDMGITALAGPLSNIVLALALTIVYKIFLGLGDVPALRQSNLVPILVYIFFSMAWINLYLAVFNLLPIPPLDGSKIIGALLPEKLYWLMLRYDRYVAGILFMVMVFTDLLSRPLQWMAQWLMRFLDFITIPIDLLFF